MVVISSAQYLQFSVPCSFSTRRGFSRDNEKPPLRPININTANAEELQLVPGIGPVTAEKILQMRKSYGAFKRVDDLVAIRGIGKKRLDKMRKYLTVGKTAASKSAQPQTPPAKAPPPPATEPTAASEPPLTPALKR